MMALGRRSWRGRLVAPRTPAEAWRAFALEMLTFLAIVAGILVVFVLTAQGGVTLEPRGRFSFFLILVGAVTVVPLFVIYEVWLLRSRIAAFRRGEHFVDLDEAAPDAVPPPSGRKRRETPAQARRRRAFWRETVLMGIVWLFCTGVIGWVALDLWLEGRPLGNLGPALGGLVVLYPVAVFLSYRSKVEKDRGV